MKLPRPLAWGCTLLLPLGALAAEPVSPAPLSLTSLLQVLVALGVVLAAILGAAWLLRRFGPTQMGPGGAMRVLGGVMVGPRERLVLVEVGETWLIVGVAPGHVSAVHSLPRPPEAERLIAAAPAAPFSAWLKEAWHKRSAGSN